MQTTATILLSNSASRLDYTKSAVRFLLFCPMLSILSLPVSNAGYAPDRTVSPHGVSPHDIALIKSYVKPVSLVSFVQVETC